jgi:ATP-dependent DNA ligase
VKPTNKAGRLAAEPAEPRAGTKQAGRAALVIDGEPVVPGVDGIADFNALHSRRHDEEVQLYAFDILALDGEDLRSLPLSMRKTTLA